MKFDKSRLFELYEDSLLGLKEMTEHQKVERTASKDSSNQGTPCMIIRRIPLSSEESGRDRKKALLNRGRITVEPGSKQQLS